MRLDLKLAILACGKSQRQVAHECGISEKRVSDIVRGWRSPTAAELQRIAAAVGRKPMSDALLETLQDVDRRRAELDRGATE